jgi:RNA polymerase I-specific transcription initiation factor RRN6
MKIQVLDVDEASSSLHDLLHGNDPDNANSVRRIASAHLLHLGEDDHPTISRLYDNILQSWIAPLPPDIPLRVRQRKERLARRIAAEVMLASCCIRPREMQATVTESQPQFSQDSDISVPILPSQPLEGSPINSSQWMSSQPLPSSILSQSQRPLSRLSPAYISQSQSSQTVSSRTAHSADPLTRLSKHLKFREDSVSQAIVPASVDQLLSHWKPGADPRDYEWDAAERATRTEVIDEASQRESEKARKRRERQERRQQREDELMRSQPSSQPFMFTKPTAFPRSSPGPMLGGMGSSSQAPSQPLTQVPLPASSFRSQGGFDSLTALSQVEPGRFGGRPEKKKKKTRISGF